MDSRLELCFALENDPYVPPRTMGTREISIRDNLAASPKGYTFMWKHQQTWHNARDARWNQVKGRIISL